MSRSQPNVLPVTTDQLVPLASALRDAILERNCAYPPVFDGARQDVQ